MEHIKEDYVSFETAKLLKKKGFNVVVLEYYLQSPDGIKHGKIPNISSEHLFGRDWNNYYLPTRVSCPTQALVLKWLRIKYNIHIEIIPSAKERYFARLIKDPEKTHKGLGNFDYILIIGNKLDNEFNCWGTPEEATEAAIQYTLKNLI